MELISIIIPTYNRAKYINETLTSLIRQTYSNWECIIVDDGSTDNTIEVVNNFIKNDDRFLFYERDIEPKGAPTCRNIGLENAKGEYIKFLDSDDWLTETALEDQTLNSRTNEVSFINGKRFFVKKKYYNNIFNLKKEVYESIELLSILINTDQFIPLHSWLIPKAIIVDNKIQWDTLLKKNQDGEFILNILRVVPKVRFINTKSYAVYRKEDINAITASNSIEKVDSILKVIDRVKEVILSSKIKNKNETIANLYYALFIKLGDEYKFRETKKNLKKETAKWGAPSIIWHYHKCFFYFRKIPVSFLLSIMLFLKRANDLSKKIKIFIKK
ncbi:glycosyltransferase family 2 protein [Flammeovirga pacifica]|uniref:Glycosyltransferase 2-like domain-containing protein n=1 Tax=Flammeovirga pacifica TaxID=915059 RepID=A0A1S1YX06_FLAPC|nr:glycosyltransferase family A protein [Flammeovirga pacifica]OHX65559.1 hypothetical protein NH26_03950 [Flammeovirga pacifica]